MSPPPVRKMKNPTPAAEILCGLRAAWGLYIVLNFRTTEPGKEGSRGENRGRGHAARPEPE